MIVRIWLPIMILAIIFSADSVYAEILTLKQAISIALKENPGLKSYKWQLKAQKEDLNSAKGHLYPKVRFEERFQRTNNPTYGFMSKLNQERFTQNDFLIDSLNNPADISDFQTSFSIEQPLYVPGLHDGINMAGRELEAQESEFRMKKEKITLNVFRAFYMIHTGKEHLKAAKKAMKDALEHKRLASLRFDSGTGLYSDMLRSDVAVNRAETMLIKAESNLEIAKRSLGLILGRTEPVDIMGEGLRLPLNDHNGYLTAAKQREDLKAMRLRQKVSKRAVRKEKAAFLPEAGIGASYFLNDHKNPFSPEGESYLLAGYLRWDLFDASTSHNIKKAKAKMHQIKEALIGMEIEINFMVNESYIRIKEKEQALSLFRAGIKEAEEALRLVRVRYENSLAPMVDLLDTQLMLDNARVKLVEAENDYLNAIATLYYQSGLLLKTVSINNQ